MSDYGFDVLLANTSFDDAVAKVTDALKAEGFGVLTRIDVKETLKKKIDVDFQRYEILGACNPKLAHRALSTDSSIGLLLPCNVTVEQVDGGVRVSIVDPKAMFQVVKGDALKDVAEEAESRLRRVASALG
ncbi:MAG: DUF302 domain-containing protein [Myxococcales bacterium]|nr:DUF302 domain-containing protein [Myxococcales bacterium]MCB9577066.1 DUF302 domain-containing protein [Polyangiaceae bacterium]